MDGGTGEKKDGVISNKITQLFSKLYKHLEEFGFW